MATTLCERSLVSAHISRKDDLGDDALRRGDRHRLRVAVRSRGRRPGRRRRGARDRDARLPARRAGPIVARVAGRHRGAAGARLGVAGARRLRRGAALRRPPCPRGRRRGAGPGGRYRHGLHRLHDGAHHRGRHPAERARGLPRRAARLRQALEAPRRPAARRSHQRARAQAGRGLAAPLRRADLLGVGVRQGTPAARGGPGRVRRDGALGRGRGLDRLAADRHLRPQRLHRWLQGHLPGRHLPDPGLPRRAEPRVRRLRERQARPHHRRARRRCRHPQRGGRRAGPACPPASRSRSATSTPT